MIASERHLMLRQLRHEEAVASEAGGALWSREAPTPAALLALLAPPAADPLSEVGPLEVSP